MEISDITIDDKSAIKEICINTAIDSVKHNPRKHLPILLQYCNPYINCVNCLCYMAKEENKPIGYILSSPSLKTYQISLQNEFKKNKTPFYTRIKILGSSLVYKKFSKQYPAHLHIDILSEYTNKKVGTSLMQKLFSSLQERGIKGICLCVASDNIRAINFYEKMGFNILKKNKYYSIFAKTIKENSYAR